MAQSFGTSLHFKTIKSNGLILDKVNRMASMGKFAWTVLTGPAKSRPKCVREAKTVATLANQLSANTHLWGGETSPISEIFSSSMRRTVQAVVAP